MNNKKAQAQMQIDVSFVSDTSKLVKSLQDATKNLDLGSPLAKQFETEMTKGFKDTLNNLSKMEEGLGKKGLSAKTYTEFFNSMNLKIQESTKFLGAMKSDLQSIFNSKENKQAIKDLEDYKKQLQEINKLVASQKGAETRRNTAINKMREETGINYEISKRTIFQIAGRKADKKDLTKAQSDWLTANGLDEAKLKRVLELLKQINAQDNKIHDNNTKAKNITGQSNTDAASVFLNKQIGKLESTAIDENKYKEWAKILSQLNGLIDDVYQSSEKLDAAFKQELPRATEEANKVAEAQRTIKEILGQFGIVFSAATVVRGFQDMARSAYDFYLSLDSALNQIYVVSNLSSKAVDDLQDKFVNMAKNTGMSIDDVTQSAVLFYQQGLNTDEVLEMTKVTSQFAKVAGIDATDAADKLTAAVNGYCLSAQEASIVADKFNKVAADTAADIDELSTAFSKAAAQANQAGVSMDNYLAYIATMEEATREAPENIGTSLKTIFSRMQQVKELGEVMEDGATDINKVETALKSVGVELLDDNRQLRNLEDVFAELGPMWNTLDRNTQAYLGTIIAGTRQQSRFITLMQNWDRVLEVSAASENSAGQQALMHAKAMESIESKVQQLGVAWQQFVSQLINSSAIKKAIDLMTKFLNKINTGNKPITILATSIGLLANKMKSLQVPIQNKIKDIGKFFTFAKKDKLSRAEKQDRLANNEKMLESQKQIVNKAQDKFDTTLKAAQELQLKDKMTKKDKERYDQLSQELKTEEELLRVEKERLGALEKQKENITQQSTSWKEFAQGLTAAGTGISTLGLLVSELDDNMGSAISTAGTFTTAIGQIGTGNWIGGITTAAVGIYQLINTMDNWDKNKSEKITKAVQNVSNSIEKYSNAATKQKSVASLVNKYDSLANKLYRTNAEQEELNQAIQDLGDLTGVDVITDSYGNLAINIGQVREELNKLGDKQASLLQELTKAELDGKDSLSNWWHSATEEEIEKYYDELITENRTQYRSLMSGIKDNLTDDARGISNSLYQAIQSSFKENMLNRVTSKDSRYMFDQAGIAKSVKQMEDSFNQSMSSADWQTFYSGIDTLQSEIDSLSWDDFQNRLDDIFGKWWQDIGLTKQQWLELKGVIEDTVYGSDEFTKYMQRYSVKGSDYQIKQNNADEIRRQLESYSKIRVTQKIATSDDVGPNGEKVYGGFSEQKHYYKETTLDELIDYINKNKISDKSFSDSGKYAVQENKSGGFGIHISSEDSGKAKEYINQIYDYAKALREAKQAEDELNSSRGGLAKTLGEASPEVVNAIKQYKELFGEVHELDSTGAYKTNSDGTFVYAEDKIQDKYASIINNILKTVPEGYEGNEVTIYLEAKLEEAIENTDDKRIRKQLENTINEVTNGLQRTGTFTWSGIIESLDKYSASLQTTNNALRELKEEGAMTNDTFHDLAGTLDSLSLEDVFESFDASDSEAALDYIDGLVQALKDLDVEYSANTGAVRANAEALEYIQDAQERAAKGKIKSMIKDLAASKAAAEMQVGYIDAQIAAVDAMINYLDTEKDQKVDSNTMMAQADTAYSKVFGDTTDKATTNYQDLTGDSAEWAEVTIKNIAEVTKAWSEYWQAVRNGDANANDLLEHANNVSEGHFKSTSAFSDASGIDLSEINGLSKTDNKVAEKKAQLEKYKEGLRQARAKYAKTVGLYEGRIEYLQSMLNSDLSNWGKSSNGKDKEKQISEYIGKLWEIHNVLNKIEATEKRLSVLEKANSKAYGKAAANLMAERLRLSKSTLELRRQELLQQKNLLKSEQRAISNSTVGNVFSFDSNGTILVNYEKYRQLQDQTIDGEQSLKELADNLWDEYKELYEGITKYSEEYIDNIDEIIGLEEEQLNTYIKFEKDVASATKEIYQEMLDNKLDTIDKEIDALDKLREARKRNREDEQNSRDLSKTQISLNRALMDTSGASNIKQLDYRDQIRQKLEDMGETAYERKMDDIKQTLEDQKDMLQKAFDEFFKDWEQFYQLIESRIITSEDAAIDVLKHTSSYREASDIERQQMIRDWGTQYQTAMSDIGAGRTIKDVYDSINALRSDMLNSLDSTIATGVAGDRIGREISTAIREFFQSYGSTDTDKELRDLFGSAVFASGGMASFTGPAWLDGTKSAPEAVLNAAQTKAFMNFANCIEKMNLQDSNGLGSNNITISSIEFNVESMSSPEDGEKAFDAFVQRFNDIGKRTGIALTTTQKV